MARKTRVSLTQEQETELVRLFDNNHSAQQLAELFGVAKSTVYRIYNKHMQEAAVDDEEHESGPVQQEVVEEDEPEKWEPPARPLPIHKHSKSGTPFTEAEFQEMLKVYTETNTLVRDIATIFDISEPIMYQMFKERGLEPTRLGPMPGKHPVYNGRGKETTQEVVVVDPNPEGEFEWVVRFLGEICVVAADIDGALAKARKTGLVNTVYSVELDKP